MGDYKILESLCEKENVDYQLARKLKERIFPLLEEAHRRVGYRFDKAFLEQKGGMDIRFANSRTILLLLKKLRPQDFSAEEQKAISLHLEFLTLFEGIYATQINFLTFILIANGHNLNSTKKGTYAKTLGDIEELALAKKLRFSRKHGFRKLIGNKDDARKLRNSIAHLFYQIDANGTIKVEGKSITQDGYDKLYNDLRNISYSIQMVNQLYYKRFASFPPSKLKEARCSCGYVNLVPLIRTAHGREPLECTKCGKRLAEPKEPIRIRKKEKRTVILNRSIRHMF